MVIITGLREIFLQLRCTINLFHEEKDVASKYLQSKLENNILLIHRFAPVSDSCHQLPSELYGTWDE
jgi:hypothetical protein